MEKTVSFTCKIADSTTRDCCNPMTSPPIPSHCDTASSSERMAKHFNPPLPSLMLTTLCSRCVALAGHLLPQSVLSLCCNVADSPTSLTYTSQRHPHNSFRSAGKPMFTGANPTNMGLRTKGSLYSHQNIIRSPSGAALPPSNVLKAPPNGLTLPKCFQIFAGSPRSDIDGPPRPLHSETRAATPASRGEILP